MTDASARRSDLPMEALMEMVGGAQATVVVQAAVELGVFDQLAGGSSDAGSVAAEIKADERGTRILLEALAAIGLVEIDAGGYRLSPLADAALVHGRPAYFGGMVRLMADMLQRTGPHLAAAVRHGGTVLEENADAPEFALFEEFAAASAPMARVHAEALAGILAPFVAGRDGGLDVLDVACGSGLYSLTLAGRYPQARVTLNDWANVLEVTRGTVDRLGLGDRAAFLPGDVFEIPLGGPYDLIVASNIFHMFSEERSRRLLGRLAGALRPGGRLAIQGPMAAGAPTDDRFPRLFSMLLLAMTSGGEAHTLSTYERLLADAGLVVLDVHDLPGVNGSRSLIAGHRP